MAHNLHYCFATRPLEEVRKPEKFGSAAAELSHLHSGMAAGADKKIFCPAEITYPVYFLVSAKCSQ